MGRMRCVIYILRPATCSSASETEATSTWRKPSSSAASLSGDGAAWGVRAAEGHTRAATPPIKMPEGSAQRRKNWERGMAGEAVMVSLPMREIARTLALLSRPHQSDVRFNSIEEVWSSTTGAGCYMVSRDFIVMGRCLRTLHAARRTCLAAAGVISCAGLFVFNLISSTGTSPGDRTGSREAEQPLALGRQLFENRCAPCHGLDGRGGERALDIATRAAAQRRSDAAIAHSIKAGMPSAGMPAFSTLDDSNLRALVAYLRFLQGRTRVTKLPGD